MQKLSGLWFYEFYIKKRMERFWLRETILCFCLKFFPWVLGKNFSSPLLFRNKTIWNIFEFFEQFDIREKTEWQIIIYFRLVISFSFLFNWAKFKWKGSGDPQLLAYEISYCIWCWLKCLNLKDSSIINFNWLDK